MTLARGLGVWARCASFVIVCGCAGSGPGGGGCGSARCGDGERDDTEECDLGAANHDLGQCKSDCTSQECGDGFLGPGEGCDDGNLVPDDACGADCAPPSCGDGIVQTPEACDDGNDVEDDACTNACASPSCGDAIRQDTEDCDDGNAVETDACLATCVDASCGDGFVHAGEEACDDQNASNEDECVGSCEDARCGDGYVHDGVEACDDRNFDDTDDCLSTCEAASCGDGEVWSGVEACDDGVNDGAYDGCMPDCESLGPRCGDGDLNGVEFCDDGNAVEDDGCASDCTRAADVLWTQNWGNADTQAAYAVDTDASGNAYVVGIGMGATDWDILVVKYDPDGSVVWSRTQDGSALDAWDEGLGVAVDPSGDVIVSGWIDGVLDDFTGDLSGGHAWVRKYDPDGNVLWTRAEVTTGAAIDVTALPDGRFVLTGYEEGAGSDLDFWTAKYEADSTPIWTRVVDGGAGDQDAARAVAAAADGSLAVVGATATGAGTLDGWLRKYDADGNVLWTRTYDRAGEDDSITAVAIDGADDSIFVAGYDTDDGVDFRTWLRKYDADGTAQWTETFDGDYGGIDYASGLAVDTSGDVIVAGAEETGDLNLDAWVRRYDADGEVLWTNVYDEAGFDDLATDVAIDADSDLLVCGYVAIDDVDFADLWLRKYGP